ncbi:hypothetical protein SAY87_029318 [Trapa incisa]|uniref:Uncharacterized protein n=1 Tax=Trapa incisa TaxID=236973 RepID=A0AAN7Q8Y4_9MYRT|nr:hypothetical protein SAY87_029318 [Trapa incisa]
MSLLGALSSRGYEFTGLPGDSSLVEATLEEGYSSIYSVVSPDFFFESVAFCLRARAGEVEARGMNAVKHTIRIKRER